MLHALIWVSLILLSLTLHLSIADVSSRHALFHAGTFLHLEIQRGALPMQAKKYSKELGGTAGCSMRIIEASQYSGRLEEQRKDAMQVGKREVFFGDSWFTSRRLCVALRTKLGHEYFGALKTNHSGTPKADVEEIMKDWPSGSYLVLECKEIALFYVGYKYSYKRKGMCATCNFYSAHRMHSLVFLVQFVHSLEPGTLGLLSLESPTLPNGPTHVATLSIAKSFGPTLLVSIFPNLMSLMLETGYVRTS